jgi:hypothetical protein
MRRRSYKFDLGCARSEIFLRHGLDSKIEIVRDLPVGQARGATMGTGYSMPNEENSCDDVDVLRTLPLCDLVRTDAREVKGRMARSAPHPRSTLRDRPLLTD